VRKKRAKGALISFRGQKLLEKRELITLNSNLTKRCAPRSSIPHLSQQVSERAQALRGPRDRGGCDLRTTCIVGIVSRAPFVRWLTKKNNCRRVES
jgi:hypothetical protein